MTIRIESTANVSNNQGVKCLVYGGAGVGKTRLLATAPRPIILSAEKGLLSLRQQNIPYIRIDSYKQLEEAHAWATKSHEAKQFDTLGLDSVSEIAEVVLSEEKTKNRDPRKAYGTLSESMIGLLRDFRDLQQKHVCFLAKQEFNGDGVTTPKIARPSFPGQALASAAPYFFDEVFQLVAWVDPATQQRMAGLKTCADLGNEGKDRSGALDMWEPPDLSHIVRKIMATV